jgi:hypothetical protein
MFLPYRTNTVYPADRSELVTFETPTSPSDQEGTHPWETLYKTYPDHFQARDPGSGTSFTVAGRWGLRASS